MFFFHSTRYITLSINFSYITERRPVFFTNWKFLFILRVKNKYVIHRSGSVRIEKNCALDPRSFLKTALGLGPFSCAAMVPNIAAILKCRLYESVV